MQQRRIRKVHCSSLAIMLFTLLREAHIYSINVKLHNGIKLQGFIFGPLGAAEQAKDTFEIPSR